MGNVIELFDEEKFPDSPIGRAEMLCVNASMDAEQIATNCSLMPEVYLREREMILEISFQACKALEILDKHQREQILTRMELRE